MSKLFYIGGSLNETKISCLLERVDSLDRPGYVRASEVWVWGYL